MDIEVRLQTKKSRNRQMSQPRDLPFPFAITLLFPGRSSDLRIILTPASSHKTALNALKFKDSEGFYSDIYAGVVPVYSGGTVPDSHRIPFLRHQLATG